jgi:6-phosphogluconolactonase (cycloisomerase 2 family)
VVSTLPSTFTGDNTGAEIFAAPSGRFVFGSNRGHDSIVTLAIDQANGMLTPVAWELSQGAGPRFFALDPLGAFLYAANENSHTIVTFRVDQTTGKLTPTGHVVKTGSPVCIVFTAAHD